ncbi:MAG: pyruvate, phosphate dikinase [Candidatus Krumholzibacteria bacterium]|nr:pyruvate, phosphate dikinase [Candidatus Krumholzibacteria bacterium]
MNKERYDDDMLRFFREREKELECLYRVEEILKKHDAELDQVCMDIAKAIPSGWQHPDDCRARVVVGADVYQPPDFRETECMQRADILVNGKKAGGIEVYYVKTTPEKEECPFLKQEMRLLQTIADRLGSFMLHQILKGAAETKGALKSDDGEREWRAILNLVGNTDRNLFNNISERMLNHLCWSGVAEADRLRENNGAPRDGDSENPAETNKPKKREALRITDELSAEIFNIASTQFTDDQIMAYLQKWIQEDKLKFLMQLTNRNTTLAGVVSTLRDYRTIAPEGIELTGATKSGVEVALIRRFYSGQLEHINIAKKYIGISDYSDVIDRIIYCSDSHGRLGGKCAGLHLAYNIIKKSDEAGDLLRQVRIPRSWHLTSDLLLVFLEYNNLDEIIEQKYKDINQIRLEYPNVIRSFKNGRFPPEIVQGLSMMLDEFQFTPLIIRSSSLLEDSLGAAFSGKYKSLFLANQGSKQKRLEALMDAIAEVYASTFGPDPIEYRSERGLLDFSEEMGIMIQEVVGTRIGDYYLPAFSGVAFSRNEFLWSPRIRREDGLIRMVPGLGTRAVDRLGDDFPILLAPGNPSLRVNVTPEESIYYSPRMADVINLKTNSFETVVLKDFFRETGTEIPMIEKIVSVYENGHLHKAFKMRLDFSATDAYATFEGLVTDTPFMKKINGMLKLLEEKLGTPVDIEFAHDGRDLYLLQCRPQSYSEENVSAPIPQGTPPERKIFSANRYVSNGRVPGITHIVYVDPEKYSELEDRDDLLAVGRAVGKLNKLLPKRQFILMGPGRWGSRGDIKLGVSITYSDINNTAVLIEIARKKGNYVPDLSFGTHFFQDLVEGHIRYLPLYPDDDGIVFNEDFLRNSKNILSEVLLEFGHLSDTIRLIDVPEVTGGLVLRVLMNADLGEAVGILAEPGSPVETAADEPLEHEDPADQSWVWRLRMAEHIASRIDPKRFGVQGFYVFGSTKNATAGLASDIDILIHFRGRKKQREDLAHWLEGWSLCLDELNYLRTGYRTGGLLDVHFVTDEDISNRTSFAVKIGAITDAARSLPVGTALKT